VVEWKDGGVGTDEHEEVLKVTSKRWGIVTQVI